MKAARYNAWMLQYDRALKASAHLRCSAELNLGKKSNLC